MDDSKTTYKTLKEMDANEKLSSLYKSYNLWMKCPCEKCLKMANKRLDEIRKIENG